MRPHPVKVPVARACQRERGEQLKHIFDVVRLTPIVHIEDTVCGLLSRATRIDKCCLA